MATIASQSSLVGREVHRMWIHAGRLLLAYGDYTHNTGPIHVISFDLADMTAAPVDEITLHTEELWQARTLADGRLAVPYVDPQGSGDPTQGAVAFRALNGTWTVVTTVMDHPPTHVYDVAEHGGKFWLGGSVDTGADTSDASVWSSADGGATWTWELVISGDGFARIFALAVHAGSLYAWGSDGADPSSGRFVRNDLGGTWTREDTTGWTEAQPVTLLGQSLVLGLTEGVEIGAAEISTGPLCFPVPTGTVATALAAITEPIFDVHVSTTGAVYTLTSGGVVKRLAVDGTVTTITTALATARSLAVDETRQKAYLGTADSKVYSAPITA